MEKKELLLKTAFCCMACDGTIAPEEISLVKKMSSVNNSFHGLDVESLLNQYVADINKSGSEFLFQYLRELEGEHIGSTTALDIVDIALKTIEADRNIEYSEIRFFKHLRSKLDISDDEIIANYPGREDIEDYLLPDVIALDNQFMDVRFNNINFSLT